MNRNIAIALVLAAAASSSFADDITIDASPFVSTATSAEVRAELADAIRSGNIFAGGETSQKLNELRPDLYPSGAKGPGKTREQVKAELAEAIRTGDIVVVGESLLKQNELSPRRVSSISRTAAVGSSRTATTQ
jgi:ribosomal protein L30E